MNAPALQAPRLDIAIDGAPAPRALATAVSLVLVRGALGSPAVAEVDFIAPSVELPPLGAVIRLAVAGTTLFEGRIAALVVEHQPAGAPVHRLRAYDALEPLRHRMRFRRLDDISAEAIAAELAAELGLASRADHSATAVPAMLQAGESDLEFLCDAAARDGLYPVVEDGTLHLINLASSGDAVTLRLGQELFSATLSLSQERALGKVSVAGWSPTTLEPQTATQGLARQDAEEMRDVGLSDATALLPGSREKPLADRLAETAAEAGSAAQAQFDRAAAFDAVAEGLCQGNPELRPGRPVVLEGVAEAMAGRYVLATVTHRFASTGFTTEFSTRIPKLHARPRQPVVTLGRVASIDDPSDSGRCRVTLPGYGDIEAGWLQTMVAGAGKRKGLAALPEPGDDVLAVFPDGDLAHGFVLGGLWGTRRLPPGLGGAADRPVVLRSGNGQELQLSGKGGVARLSANGGSLLELTPGRTRLAAASDLVIEAPGKRITIRADAIDFVRG